jgi:membrane-associated phospholipid phosphatase
MGSRVAQSILVAVSCVAALAITALLAFKSSLARSVDAESLTGFNRLAGHPLLADLADRIASGATLPVYAGAGAVLAAIAFARRRRRLAVAVPLALVAASVSTAVLKDLLSHPRPSHWLTAADQIPAGSWPSGHATAAMMLALCALVVAAPRFRPLVACIGGVVAIGVGYTTLILAWHFPSDVVGGLLVAGMWVWVMLAALSWSESGRPLRRPDLASTKLVTLTPAGLVVTGVCALALSECIVKLHASMGASVVATAFLIALVVASLIGGLLVALRGLGSSAAGASAS